MEEDPPYLCVYLLYRIDGFPMFARARARALVECYPGAAAGAGGCGGTAHMKGLVVVILKGWDQIRSS